MACENAVENWGPTRQIRAHLLAIYQFALRLYRSVLPKRELVYGLQSTSIMALTLTDVRLIASEVARREEPSLDVVGVTPREGSSTSAEVIFADRACDREPCRVVIGVSRRLSADECRGAVRARLRERRAQNRRPPA